MHIDQNFDNLIAEDSAIYQSMLNQLTPLRRRILAALTSPANRGATVSKVARQLNCGTTTVPAAREVFLDDELIREVTSSTGKTEYRLVDPFFGHYLDRLSRGVLDGLGLQGFGPGCRPREPPELYYVLAPILQIVGRLISTVFCDAHIEQLPRF